MGTFVGTISHRNAVANSVPRLVEFFNKITEAILGCGMVKVADADFAGQAGTFTADAPAAGQTQVTALGTTTGVTVCGQNLFKHPTRNIYVRVEYLDVGFSTTASRCSYVRYTVATSLVSGALDNAVTVNPQSAFTVGNSVAMTVIPATYAALWASCGDDHFWICSRPVIVLSNTTSVYTLPHSFSAVAIAVLVSAEDPSVLAVMAPVEVSSSGSALQGPNFGTSSNLGGVRYWVTNGGVWSATQPCSLGSVPDPSVPTSSAGVRVARGSKIVDGLRNRFNLGYINSGSVNDGALIDVDLIGEQRTYRACWGFGPASPTFYNATANDLSGTLLPWAA